MALEPLPTADVSDAAPVRIAGVPIGCGGLEVRPGDIVYGDADGVVVVPRELHQEVRARVGST